MTAPPASVSPPTAPPPAASAPPPPPPGGASWPYPPAPRGPVAEERFGVHVADPYRWLEDLDSNATIGWVTSQNALADSYFARVLELPRLRTKLEALVSIDAYGLPMHRGDRYFWTHRGATQGQAVLMTSAQLDGGASGEKVVLDPNAISPDGKLAYTSAVVASDGKALTYGLAEGGGDWTTWRARRLTGSGWGSSEEPDILDHTKYYAPTFTRDGKALYYSRFPPPAPGRELSEVDHDCKVYLHTLGTPTSTDTLAYERPEHTTWQFAPTVTRDGRYLVITIGDGEVWDRGQEQLAYLDLTKPGAKPVSLIDTFEAEYEFLGNLGPIFYVRTSQGAPPKQIVAIDVRSPARGAWKEIVPAGADAIESATLVGRQLIVTTLHDAQSAVAFYDLKGRKLHDLVLPGPGTVRGFAAGADESETFYEFSSFTVPGTVYRYDLAKETSTLWREPAVPFDASQIEAKQVFFASKDGTKVPLFLVAKKGLRMDGANPTLLYGYGGFGIAITPQYAASQVAWVEAGGVVAIAGIRGGGEYGEAWHLAGTRTHKQIVFDDFIAAAEWLTSSGVTSPARLGIFGRSNGGLLVGAVVTQRPDLFGAAAVGAGVLDMLRFPLFGQGAGWEGDYGSPEDPAEFKALFAYSPVHNVRAGTTYPAITDHDRRPRDARVAPLHSYKLAAALQAGRRRGRHRSSPSACVEKTSGQRRAERRPGLSRVDQSAELLGFFTQSLKSR